MGFIACTVRAYVSWVFMAAMTSRRPSSFFWDLESILYFFSSSAYRVSLSNSLPSPGLFRDSPTACIAGCVLESAVLWFQQTFRLRS